MNKFRSLINTPYILLLLALSVRLAYWAWGAPITGTIWSDMRVYLRIAEEILAGIWRPDQFFQPIGYPLFISYLMKTVEDIFPVLNGLQALASFASVYFIYRLVDETMGRKIAMISLLLTSLHVPWILFENFAFTETFFIFFLSLNAWLTGKIVKRDGSSLVIVGWALSFLSAFWFKGTHVFWGPLFLFGLIFAKKEKALKPILIICPIVALGLCLHGLFTYKTIGKFQMTASAGGLNFVEGKCPSKKNIGPDGIFWHSPLYHQLEDHTTKQWDEPFYHSSYFMKSGLECIRENPAVLMTSFESIPLLFYGNTTWPINQLPFKAWIRLYELYFAFFVVVGLSCFVISVWRNKDATHEIVIWGLPILSVFICVYIFKSETRFRIPFDIWFIPVAVLGWTRLIQSLGKTKD